MGNDNLQRPAADLEWGPPTDTSGEGHLNGDGPSSTWSRRLERRERRGIEAERWERVEAMRDRIRLAVRRFERERGDVDIFDIESAVIERVLARPQFDEFTVDELRAYTYTAAKHELIDRIRSTMRHSPSAAPGWYVDPIADARERYWTGSTWSQRVRAGGNEWRSPVIPTARQCRLPESIESLSERTGDAWQGHAVDEVERLPPDLATYQRMCELIDRLPERQALAIRMVVSGQSYLDVAVELGISEGAANSLLLRARRRLASLFERDGLITLAPQDRTSHSLA